MNYRHFYLMGFVLSAAAISYYQMKECHRLPWPPRLIHTGMVFVCIDLMSMFNEEVAGIVAIGFVIAIFVKRGWVADCSEFQTAATGQPQTTSFLGNSVDATGNPPNYDIFSGAGLGT
jgi:hypothetical protein